MPSNQLQRKGVSITVGISSEKGELSPQSSINSPLPVVAIYGFFGQWQTIGDPKDFSGKDYLIGSLMGEWIFIR